MSLFVSTVAVTFLLDFTLVLKKQQLKRRSYRIWLKEGEVYWVDFSISHPSCLMYGPVQGHCRMTKVDVASDKVIRSRVNFYYSHSTKAGHVRGNRTE